jgi:hypothetical protein
MPDPLRLGPGGTIRFYAALNDGRRSPSTWRVWVPTNSSDVYVASRQMAGFVKTSLHQSGNWQTSFIHNDLVPTGNAGPVPSRHLDKWLRPSEFAEGFTQALTIIFPWTELVPWREEGVKPGTMRLMMEENCALNVGMLFLRPVMFPVPLRIAESVSFATFNLGNDNEFVLVSRRIPWTDMDTQILEEQKAGSTSAARTFRDTRPDKPSAKAVRHITRMTMFKTSDRGHRYIVDAASWTALPPSGEMD